MKKIWSWIRTNVDAADVVCGAAIGLIVWGMVDLNPAVAKIAAGVAGLYYARKFESK